MPRLILFAPCERAIIEQGSNSVSLVSLLHDVNAVISGPVASAVVALRWYVISIWRRVETESTQAFEQQIKLTAPSGHMHVDLRTDFEMEKPMHRNVGVISNFPIAEAGEHTLELLLRPAGRGDWESIAKYPIIVSHTSPTAH
jgi:hypothetical protein